MRFLKKTYEKSARGALASASYSRLMRARKRDQVENCVLSREYYSQFMDPECFDGDK